MSNQKFYGVYRGTVFDNRDPYGSNRLKIVIPQILGATPTEWAWGMSDANVHTTAPDIGQGVLVMFEGGDPVYPIWIGTFGKTSKSNFLAAVHPIPLTATKTEDIVGLNLPGGSSAVDVLASLFSLANSIADVNTSISVGIQGQLNSLEERVYALESALSSYIASHP